MKCKVRLSTGSHFVYHYFTISISIGKIDWL